MGSRSVRSQRPRRVSAADCIDVAVARAFVLDAIAIAGYKRVVGDELLARTASDARIAQLEREVDRLRGQLAETESVFARLQSAYTHALEQLSLLRRRLFAAKAERRNVAAEQLAFDTMFADVTRLAEALDAAEGHADSDSDSGSSGEKKASTKPQGHGRRDLTLTDLPVEEVEIADPALEGVAERIGTEQTSRLGYRRDGPIHILLNRIRSRRRSRPMRRIRLRSS